MDDLDALFIDQQQPAQPLPAGLHQRIADMQKNGCCEFKESEGRWIQEDHKPSILQEQIQEAFQTKPIAHMSWNPNGYELALADTCGRVIICAPFVNANKLITQKAYRGTENEANRLVGFYWLQPIQPKKPGSDGKGEKTSFLSSAVKKGNRWIFGPPEMLAVLGPANPWGKSGFLAITALGKLQLHYSTPDMNWFNEEQELFKPEDPGALITHAAFCASRENEVVLVTIDGSKNARLVNVKLKWVQNPGQQREHPQLEVENLFSFKLVGPSLESPLTSTLSGGSLSFVRLLYDRTAGHKDETLPTLLAAYHSLPSSGTDFGANATGASTVLVQYDMRYAIPELEETFDKLQTKRPKQRTPKVQMSVSQADDVQLEGIVLDLKEQTFGRSLALSYSDGKVEFRDRELKIIPLETSPDEVSSLQQIGFSFNAGEPCLHNVFSSHSCVRATMARDEKPKLSVIQVSVPLMEVADSAFFDKAGAAFVLEYIGKSSSSDFIDIMAVMRAFLDQLTPEKADSWKTMFLRTLAYAMQIPMKMHDQGQELMIFVNVLQRFLSIQEALGHGTADLLPTGETSPRTPSSHLAWILQNLRQLMAVNVMLVLRPFRPGEQPPWMRPEASAALGHYGAWCCTLAEWIVSQILAANRLLNYPQNLPDLPFPPGQINNHLPVSARVAGALLMLPLGRTCLKLCLSGFKLLQSKVDSVPTHEMPEQWRPMEKAIRDRVFLHTEFLRFLDSCEGICNRVFTSQPGSSDNKEAIDAQREMARRAIETETLIKGQCERNLAMPLAMLVTRGAWDLRKSCREGDVILANFQPLDPLPADDDRTIKRSADVIWDGSRKFELGRRKVVWADEEDPPPNSETNGTHSNGVNGHSRHILDTGEELTEERKLSRKWMTSGKEIPPLRICTRCANVMEDQPPQRARHQSDPLASMMRQCYCGGRWVDLKGSQ